MGCRERVAGGQKQEKLGKSSKGQETERQRDRQTQTAHDPSCLQEFPCMYSEAGAGMTSSGNWRSGGPDAAAPNWNGTQALGVSLSHAGALLHVAGAGGSSCYYCISIFSFFFLFCCCLLSPLLFHRHSNSSWDPCCARQAASRAVRSRPNTPPQKQRTRTRNRSPCAAGRSL